MNSTMLTQAGGTHYTHTTCSLNAQAFWLSLYVHTMCIQYDTSWTFLIKAGKLLTIIIILQERHLGTF